MNKIIIWALFDDGNCSYKKAIEQYFPDRYEIYSIGINDLTFENYRKINLDRKSVV